jgi:hypothetical protein
VHLIKSLQSMKTLLLLSLTFLPLPVSAITWGEFWAPFTYDRVPRRYYEPICRRRVYREEYVPGDRWNPGYVRSWSEWISVPCDY